MAEGGADELFFLEEALDAVVLSDQEKEDYINNYIQCDCERNAFDCFSDISDDGLSSGSNESPTLATRSTCPHFHKANITILSPYRGHFKNFIRATPTCEWNFGNADQVYYFINATQRIVRPDHFLAVFEAQDWPIYTVNALLRDLDQHPSPRCMPWRTMPVELDEFFEIFSGVENLADCIHNSSEATEYINRFQFNIRTALRQCKSLKFQNIFRLFLAFTNDLNTSLNVQDNVPTEDFSKSHPSEEFSKPYFDLLMKVFNDEVDSSFCSTALELFFQFDAEDEITKERKNAKVIKKVHPELVLKNAEGFILIGELKKYGKYEQHRGTIPKAGALQSSENGDSKEACSRPVEAGDDEKCVSPRRLFSRRALDSRERYKVQSFLPQLLGHLLALMLKCPPTILGSSFENVQHGFGIEGFKLRFVKLVLRDHIRKRQHMKPTVEKFLSGTDYQSDVFITQEFNLFKGAHVRMLFQMLLAFNFLFQH